MVLRSGSWSETSRQRRFGFSGRCKRSAAGGDSRSTTAPGLCARAKRDLQSLDARSERRRLNAEKLGRPASAINSVIRSLQRGDQVLTFQGFHFRIGHDLFLGTIIGDQRFFDNRVKLFPLFRKQHRVENLLHT
jgi:hypothetical protein